MGYAGFPGMDHRLIAAIFAGSFYGARRRLYDPVPPAFVPCWDLFHLAGDHGGLRLCLQRIDYQCSAIPAILRLPCCRFKRSPGFAAGCPVCPSLLRSGDMIAHASNTCNSQSIQRLGVYFVQDSQTAGIQLSERVGVFQAYLLDALQGH